MLIRSILVRAAMGPRGIRAVGVFLIATALLVTAACSAIPAPPPTNAPAATATPAAYPEDVAARITTATVDAMKAEGIPGALVLLQTPAGRFEQAFGVSDTSTGAPLTLDDHLRVGSITKTMTTTVLLTLVDRGEMQLDEPVRTYLPELPEAWTDVTLRHLAEMRSGIPSYTGTAAFLTQYTADAQAVFTSEQLLAFVSATPLLFGPGEGFDYSNTNTVILGMAIEKVTGASLADNLSALFGDAGLDQTGYALSGTEIPDPHPRGYTNLTADGSTVDATDWSASWGQAAGAGVSTIGDVEVWLKALVSGSLLSREAQRERMQLVPIPGNPDSTGYGVGIVRTNGWLGHNGDIAGFSTTMYARDDGSEVIVMTNTNALVMRPGADPLPPSAYLAQEISAVVAPDAPFVFPHVEG